ncbi:MAG: peptidoglycan editing factor PgeF [Pseudomonadota bacterium]|nr:peptidoglycan editing factor PgeF [Pseudomonadota bacterium]
MEPDFIIPDWPAPSNVHALVTTRSGGVSLPPYESFNLGNHVGDDADAVAMNRAQLCKVLPSEPYWLNQVHGREVAEIDTSVFQANADAAICRTAGKVLVVMTADCLPVLLCASDGSVLGVAHAGWRGLCAGVIESTLAKMCVEPGMIIAYLGPAIGPEFFEVGSEVRDAFMQSGERAAQAFVPAESGRWLGNLYELARQRLALAGVSNVFGGEFCTYREASRFFSYRRDGQTGRMATLLWKSS